MMPFFVPFFVPFSKQEPSFLVAHFSNNIRFEPLIELKIGCDFKVLDFLDFDSLDS